MNLAKKAIHGISWVFLFSITTRGGRFLTTLILARLLEPADFGLVAIGLLVINTLAMFRDMGVGAALIYQKGNIEKAANTAAILFPIIGIALFTVSYALAPYSAAFFNSPESASVIRWLSVTLFLVSLGLAPSALLDRELEFKRQAAPEIGSVIAYAAVTIPLAFGGFGVWSIVYGKIVSEMAWVAIIWVVSPWKPKLEFDWAMAESMLGYGRHIVGAGLIAFLLSNVDNGFVGKLLGATALGFYTIAFNISNLPALNITQLVNRVMFPTFSKLQDNKEALVRVYLKTIKYISVLSVPVSFGILMLAPELVEVALGEKWMPALVALQVLSIAGLFRSIRASTWLLFNAIGKPDIPERMAVYELVILCSVAYPMTAYYGIVGTAWAVVMPTLLFTIWGFKLAGDAVDIKAGSIVGVLSAPFVASIGMAAGIHMCRLALPSGGIIGLALLMIAGGGVYVPLVCLLNRELIGEFRGMLSHLTAKPVKFPGK